MKHFSLLSILCITTIPALIFIYKKTNKPNEHKNNGGMRRDMLDPYEAIQAHRIVKYKNHPYSRDLESNEGYTSNDEIYKPIRIYFETSSVSKLAFENEDYEKKVDYLKQIILPNTRKLWSDVLNVIPVVDKINVEYSWCPFGDYQYIDYDVYANGIVDHDLVVFVTGNSNICYNGDGSASGTLASAFSCSWDQYQRPIAGNIDFCLDSIELDDSEDAESYKKAIGTATHEFGHLLGISSNDFLFYYDWSTGLPRTPHPSKQEVTCVNGSQLTLYIPSTDILRLGTQIKNPNNPYYEIVTPTVKSVIQNQFNCSSFDFGGRLENTLTFGDCFGSHWDERLYFTELMSSIQTDVTEYLSSLTLGLLYDSGWYKPNFEKAEISPFGLHAGCDFVREDCIVDSDVPSYSAGFFCNREFKPGDDNVYVYGCDPTHYKMAICDLIDFSNHPDSNKVPPPPEYQYFDNPLLGSIMQTADYCPTYSAEAISCYNFPKSDANILPSIFDNTTIKEDYSINSRCIDLEGSTRPACFHVTCNEENHTVVVRINDEENVICEYDAQKHVLPSGDTTMSCPRLSVVCPTFTCPTNCAGKGKCDLTRIPPTCICYDPDDTSPGCTDSIEIIPPKVSYKDGSSTATRIEMGFYFVLFQLFFILIGIKMNIYF